MPSGFVPEIVIVSPSLKSDVVIGKLFIAVAPSVPVPVKVVIFIPAALKSTVPVVTVIEVFAPPVSVVTKFIPSPAAFATTSTSFDNTEFSLIACANSSYCIFK